jgi:hypothetical protein
MPGNQLSQQDYYRLWVRIFFKDDRSIAYERKCLEESALRSSLCKIAWRGIEVLIKECDRICVSARCDDSIPLASQPRPASNLRRERRRIKHIPITIVFVGRTNYQFVRQPQLPWQLHYGLRQLLPASRGGDTNYKNALCFS